MTNLTPSSIQELAEQLAGPAHYQFDLLLEGLERERWRLGSRRYLTVSWRHEFDVDGLTDWVYLGKSFRSLDDAKRHAAQELADLKDAYLSKAHGSWVVDPDRESHFLPQVRPHDRIRVLDERRLTLTGPPLCRAYFCARVLGPFTSTIVDEPLLDLLSELKFELWSFFVDAGEAAHVQQVRRTSHEAIVSCRL